MKQLILSIALLFLCHFFAVAQNNCTAPTVVTVCPDGVTLTAVTTSGMGNDRSQWKYSAAGFATTANGNDNVYEVNLPVGAQTLWVDTKATSVLYLIDTRSNCNATYYSSLYVSNSGCQRQTFYVTGLTKIYIWVDHNNASDISYDISFSVVTGSQYFAKGSLQPSFSCFTPIFNSKFGLTYNGVQKTYPLVYSPLNVQGTVCYKIFLKNPNGIESIKKIRFTFGPDLTNPTPAVASMPGFYSAGNWIATQISATIIEYNFVAANGRGDYSNSTTCNGYEFCFNFTPTSNSAATTTTSYTWWGDNAGNYTIYSGCFSGGTCSTSMSCNSSSCLAASASSAATGSGSTTDPFLPVTITDFIARQSQGSVELNWTTASESNSGTFEIQRSKNGNDFSSIGTMQAAGNSNEPKFYSFTDPQPFSTNSYYRLKETDLDGKITFSEIISVNGQLPQISIHPNPARSKVNITSNISILGIYICDLTGNEILYQTGESAQDAVVKLESLQAGIYLIKIRTENSVITERLIVE